MKHDRVFGFSLLMCCLLGFNSHAADWPHWLGPQRDGTTQPAGFDPAFANGGVDVKWSAELGVGFTGVTVADGKVYTAGWANGNTNFYCFDSETGDKKWSHSFPSNRYKDLNIGGTSGTAAVDGERVYHQARDGQLLCYNTADGEVIWEKDLASIYGVKAPRWGFSGSPVVIGDTLYLDIGRIIALKKTDGSEVWKTDDLGPAYSTPAPFTHQNKDYLAVFPKTGLHIIERDTGNRIAHHPWTTKYDVNAATPVVVDENIFISSDYGTGCALLRFDGQSLGLVWENKNLKNKMCTSLYHEGYFYGFNSAKLTCIDARTGEEQWNERGLGIGTVIMAGQSLVVLSDKGEILTAPVSPQGFTPTSRAQVIEGDDTMWISPTLANGRLYIRGSQGKLVCIDAR